MSRLAAFFALVSFTAALLIEAVFGFAALFTHWVRVYPVECDGQVVFETFCEGEITVPLNPVTFRAFPDRQTVTEWDSDGATEFKSCAVKDYRNWQCTAPEGRDLMIQKTMQDGQLNVRFPHVSQDQRQFVGPDLRSDVGLAADRSGVRNEAASSRRGVIVAAVPSPTFIRGSG